MPVKLKSPVKGETVDLCARYQHEFDECGKFRDIRKLILKKACSAVNVWENTTPAPVRFIWETDSEESVLEISEDISFGQADRYVTGENEISVFNLKKDSVYFWRVNGSNPEDFRTDSVMPRWIAVDGVGNVRDIGGRRNSKGLKIKQGLIFRGFRLEDLISETGREQLKRLGIKTELDLRKEPEGNIGSSPIGSEVEYVRLPCNGYDEFIRDNIGDGTCRKLIEFLSDEKNYPIYFHCHGGQDRTGTLAFLLDAILDLDDETLLREYELTMLSSPEQKLSRSRKGKFRPFLKYIRKNGSRKKSLRDNTVSFIRNAGISEETILKIRNNLLEK